MLYFLDPRMKFIQISNIIISLLHIVLCNAIVYDIQSSLAGIVK